MTRYEECLERLIEFRKLEEGWDDNQAEKISHRVIENAKVILYLLRGKNELSIFPMPSGGVQIEYYEESENRDYEIEVYNDSMEILSYEKTRDEDIYKLENTLSRFNK